jgi:23S rRNA pseudouridine2605 synthase
MNNEAEPYKDEAELKAADEIAAKDAIDASCEPPVGTAPEPGPELASSESDDSAGNLTPDGDEESAESAAEPRPEPKLERLQKILAQAGIASRRHAEQLISEGRVQVNGTVVTELGSKADAGLDHIRVDGKLIHRAERLRYFMLNKPKGFVTTASDPEGRPTVMQFFQRMPERLYPVGRLDYQSEGLLLVTNDGQLANRLTSAASGVEKTYLVKVSGRPTEAELDVLRRGVDIERGESGSAKVRTAPARVSQVRKGDNPWFEVVIVEGRNRELRKMFQEIGHFVEKIRRVGYGPLVLDIEPGKIRELDQEEIAALRRAAEGKASARAKPIGVPEPEEKKPRETREKRSREFRGEERQTRPPKREFGRKPKPFREESQGGARRARPFRGPDDRRGREGTGSDRRGPGAPGRERSFGAKPPSERQGRSGFGSAPGRDRDRDGGFGAKAQWKKRGFAPRDGDARGPRRGDERSDGRADTRGGQRERGGENRRVRPRGLGGFAERRPGGQRPESRRAGQGEFRRPPGGLRPGSGREDQGGFSPRSGGQRQESGRTRRGEFGARSSRPPRAEPRRSGPERREFGRSSEGRRPARDGQSANRPGRESRERNAGGPRNQSGRPFRPGSGPGAKPGSRPGARPGFKRRPEAGDRERSPRRDRPHRDRPKRGD